MNDRHEGKRDDLNMEYVCFVFFASVLSPSSTLAALLMFKALREEVSSLQSIKDLSVWEESLSVRSVLVQR